MSGSNYIYHHGEQELHGFLAYDEASVKPRPAVMIIHDWSGRNDFACEKAEFFARCGYVGFAVDMYGHGRIGVTTEEKVALMNPIVQDRRLLRKRIIAAYDALVTMSEVEHTKIAVIGFCFGGLCALDLARSGALISGAISVHGLLNKPEELASHPINAKVLALHGYDDPMVKPEDLKIFCDEMTQANVDWQVHMFGLTQHGFTNPAANNKNLGTIYNPIAAERSELLIKSFLKEVFA